ncbi:MAG TPA: hypothetical protein VJ023_06065 [Pyrinomonadaceae bacterium]|nr:hypothetical protein [Pyrinomonadaceae bacterium]
MFKMEETSSDDGGITGIIFMRPDGMFEGRIYRKQLPNVQDHTLPENSELCILTGTLAQARSVVHEELGCDGERCTYCKSS